MITKSTSEIVLDFPRQTKMPLARQTPRHLKHHFDGCMRLGRTRPQS